VHQLQSDLGVVLREVRADDAPDELERLCAAQAAAAHRRPPAPKNQGAQVDGALGAVALAAMPAYLARRSVQRMADVPPVRCLNVG